MPITRCPHCGQRMLIAAAVVGQSVGCSRCDRTFDAERQSSVSRLGELLLIVAASAVGVVVTWLVMRGR